MTKARGDIIEPQVDAVELAAHVAQMLKHEIVCLSHYFFFPPNGLKPPPPRPGSFIPPRPGRAPPLGPLPKRPGGGASGRPFAKSGNLPPNCFCRAASSSGEGWGILAMGLPPSPNMEAILPIAPFLAPPSDFIRSAIWRCCFNSLLTSSTFMPEPAAMRFLREAFKRSGLRR